MTPQQRTLVLEACAALHNRSVRTAGSREEQTSADRRDAIRALLDAYDEAVTARDTFESRYALASGKRDAAQAEVARLTAALAETSRSADLLILEIAGLRQHLDAARDEVAQMERRATAVDEWSAVTRASWADGLVQIAGLEERVEDMGQQIDEANADRAMWRAVAEGKP